MKRSRHLIHVLIGTCLVLVSVSVRPLPASSQQFSWSEIQSAISRLICVEKAPDLPAGYHVVIAHEKACPVASADSLLDKTVRSVLVEASPFISTLPALEPDGMDAAYRIGDPTERRIAATNRSPARRGRFIVRGLSDNHAITPSSALGGALALPRGVRSRDSDGIQNLRAYQ